ncbi:MAG: hypothetical protein WCK80_01690 [bacterium]
MNKYILLILLTAPLALYGFFNVILSYKLKKLRPLHASIRLVFWGTLLIGIFSVRPISDFLYAHDLTDTTPLSIFDVLLATGIMISLLLVARTYARIADLETRLTEMHEKLSIILSSSRLKK